MDKSERRSRVHSVRLSEMATFAPKRIAKFNNVNDLLDYAERTTGERKLTSYLIPGLEELQQTLRKKKIEKIK
jgi:hypothetical protein